MNGPAIVAHGALWENSGCTRQLRRRQGDIPKLLAREQLIDRSRPLFIVDDSLVMQIPVKDLLLG